MADDELLISRPGFAPRHANPYECAEVREAVFTPAECDAIVALGLARGPETAGLESEVGEEVHDDDVRRSRTAWLAADDDTWWIYERLAEVALWANERYRLDLTGFEEDLQFTVYDDPGAFYTWHQDGLDGAVAHRKLTLVTQLTDPGAYVGAELQFFDLEETDDDDRLETYRHSSRRQGAVVAFPAWEYHRVMPLRSGVRHSLVAWISGPPLR